MEVKQCMEQKRQMEKMKWELKWKDPEKIRNGWEWSLHLRKRSTIDFSRAVEYEQQAEVEYEQQAEVECVQEAEVEYVQKAEVEYEQQAECEWDRAESAEQKAEG